MSSLPPMLDPNIQRQFLCSLLCNREYDATVLVYADWLEESGDHQFADLIRVQLKVDECLEDWQGHEKVIQALENDFDLKLMKVNLANNSQRRSHHLEPDVFPDWSWSLDRGVVTLSLHELSGDDPIPLPPDEWKRRIGWYVIRVGESQFGGEEMDISLKGLHNLLASPLMDRCLGLELNNHSLELGFFNCILSSPRLLGMVSLDLSGTCGFYSRPRGEKLLQDLVESPNLANMLRLELGLNNFGDHGLKILAAHGRFPKLRALGLFSISASGKGVSALLESSHFSELETLHIGGAILDETALLDIANNTVFPKLKRLNLKATHINGKLARILAAATNLRGLTDLNLDDNPLSDTGAEAIVRSPHFAGTNLHLDRTTIKAKTVKALAETARFRSGTLRLWSCNLADRDLLPLTSSPESAKLTSLLLGFSKITDEGARMLAESPYLKNLHRLILDSNEITHFGLDLLLAPSAFPALRILSLDENPIGFRGEQAIARWRAMKG